MGVRRAKTQIALPGVFAKGLPICHDARFSKEILDEARKILIPGTRVFDPFAGVGGADKIHRGVFLSELEEPVIAQARGRHRVCANAIALPYATGVFDACLCSPTYANRMADTYTDDSVRHTYTAGFGYPLHRDNSGAMQWGEKYRVLHEQAWQEVYRVLKHGGLFLLNVSDHIRDGKCVPVSAWHKGVVTTLGFTLLNAREIQTSRQRHGQNGALRVECEWLMIFRKP